MNTQEKEQIAQELKNLIETQEQQAQKLKNLKIELDKATALFNQAKDEYIADFGAGTYELPDAKITISQSTTNRVDYKGLTEKYVPASVLEKVLADYTKTTTSTLCRITAKLS